MHQAGTPLKPSLYGKLDRIGLGGSTLSWHATESRSDEGRMEVPAHEPSTGLLIDWLEARDRLRGARDRQRGTCAFGNVDTALPVRLGNL